LQVEPLLSAAAGFDMISGKGAFDIDVTARGATQRQLISALNGKGGVKLNNGAVKGIDAARVLCNPLQAVEALGGRLNRDARTHFSELSLSYAIANGVLRNQDLALLAPLFRAEGRGSVDLPRRSVDYRAEPRLVASCSGQGGAAGKIGLGLPLRITGPWSNVSVTPDFNPLDILKQIDPAKALKKPGGVLKDLIPGGIKLR
jgi:AsmA protein